MSDHLAVDANEQVIVEEPKPKPLHLRIARFISNILSPAVVSLPMVFVVAFYHAPDTILAFLYGCLALFFLSIGPMLYILIGVHTGTLSDVDVSRRSERAGPYLFTISSVLVGLLVLWVIGAPKNLETILMATVLIILIMMVTNFRWKISAHASTVGGAATMLTVLYGTVLYGVVVLFSLVMLVLVGWSRVMLRRHTVGQVVAGALVSIGISTAILLWRGL